MTANLSARDRKERKENAKEEKDATVAKCAVGFRTEVPDAGKEWRIISRSISGQLE